MCICGVHVSVQASACASVYCECGWCQCEYVCLCAVCCTINVQVRLKNSPVLYFPGQKSRVGVVCVCMHVSGWFACSLCIQVHVCVGGELACVRVLWCAF